jgi:hypothetical protein
VSVYFDDGSANWRSNAKAQGTIGEGLVAFPAQNGNGPLTPDAIVDFLLRRESSPDFQKIGQHFWSLLHASAIGGFLESVWGTHVTNGNDMKAGVRTILDVRPGALRRLPWELLFRNDMPLFASPLNPMVRGSLVPGAAPVATGFLLRVLVIVGSEPGDPAVRAEDEIAYLEDSVRGFRREIDLRVERPTSRDDFVRLYGEFMPHVLHFTGHGDQVKRASGAIVPSLVFSDGNGGRWDWLATEIQATLAVGAPRLAFLNACRTGTEAAREIVGTLADAFLNAGTLGVIAMQADITGEAAAEFAGRTYSALAEGKPLDIALAQARRTVREKDNRTEYRDWCLPSLTLAVDVGDVLPSRLQLPQGRRDVLETTPEFVKIQAFVDRRTQRRSVDPMAARTPDEDVLVVTGPRSTGKTDMLLWFLEGCAWCGHTIKYVDLKRGRPGFLDVLEWIQRKETNPFSNLRQALAGDFARVRQLSDVVRAGQPTAAPTPDDPIDSLFSAFRKALTSSANGSPLTIALDHLGSMDPDAWRNYLRPYLLDHAVQRQMRPVRFVLCCTDDEYRELGVATLQPAHKVEVGPFPAKEFAPLYREFLLLKRVPRANIPAWPLEQKIDFLPQTLLNVYALLTESGQLP